MNEFDHIAQSLYLNPQLPAKTIQKAVLQAGLQFPLQIAVGRPCSPAQLPRSQKRGGKYFWAPHPGLVYILWNESTLNQKENLLSKWMLGEVFVCEKPDQFINLLLSAIVSFRRCELQRILEQQPQQLTFTIELDARRLALKKIQIEWGNSSVPQPESWQTALVLWLDIILLRHQDHLHTVRRKLQEFVSLLTCDLDIHNPIGNQFALLQRSISHTYSLSELRAAFPQWLLSLLEILPDQTLRKKGMISPLCQQAIEWMEAHHQEPISSADCAAAIPVSSSYLSRLFQKELGCTPTEYLQRLRIEKSRQLLQEDRYTIQGLAALCGFGSVEHFYRVFRKHTGLTPAAYRRNIQQK